MYESDLYRGQHCISRRVPGLKYAHVVCDSWTRLNVLPAKIMQVCQCKRLPCLMIIMVIHYSSNRTCFQLSGRFRRSPSLNLMLQHSKISDLQSPALMSMQSGFSYFQQWHRHLQETCPGVLFTISLHTISCMYACTCMYTAPNIIQHINSVFFLF